MTTTELIKLLKQFEHGTSGRPREVSLVIETNSDKCFLAEPHITFNGSGDGVAGAELSLLVCAKDTKKLKNNEPTIGTKVGEVCNRGNCKGVINFIFPNTSTKMLHCDTCGYH